MVFLRDDIYECCSSRTRTRSPRTTWRGLSGTRGDDDLYPKGADGASVRGGLSRIGGNVPWNDMFDERKEMPGRQTKYAPHCDRTFLRPRDMIKYSNEVLVALQGVEYRRTGPKFDNASRHRCSRAAIRTISLANLTTRSPSTYPSTRIFFEVSETDRQPSVLGDQFERSGTQSSDRFKDEFGQADWPSYSSFLSLAISSPGGGGGGSKYIWRYLDAGAKFDPAAQTFRVHAGFKEALDLVYGGGKDAEQPTDDDIPF